MLTIIGTNLGTGSVRLDSDPDGRFTVWCTGEFIRIRPISYPTVEQGLASYHATVRMLTRAGGVLA